GRNRVRRYTDEHCLPECVIERHSGQTSGVMVWGAILYHERSNLLRIEGNLNSNRCVRDVLQPKVVSFLQCIPAAFSRMMHARMLQTERDFFSVLHMQLLPLAAYSPDMSPIEHVWYLVGRRPRHSASKDEILLRMQNIWNSLPQANIQNLFDSTPRRIVALIAARREYTKYSNF
ncbi:transposable element Tc1 transposase, partial [Trichonephila clavipes]